MEREQVKSILNFYKEIDNEIAMRKRLIANYEEEYYSTGGETCVTSYIHSRNKISRPTETTALNVPAEIDEAMRELNAEARQLNKLKNAIMKELNKLPYPQRIIIYEFYIEGLKWVRISEQVHYGERQCKNIRNRAIDKLGRLFSQNTSISGYNFPA